MAVKLEHGLRAGNRLEAREGLQLSDHVVCQIDVLLQTEQNLLNPVSPHEEALADEEFFPA